MITNEQEQKIKEAASLQNFSKKYNESTYQGSIAIINETFTNEDYVYICTPMRTK